MENLIQWVLLILIVVQNTVQHYHLLELNEWISSANEIFKKLTKK